VNTMTMPTRFRPFLAAFLAVLALAVLAGAPARAGDTVTVTDLAGRQVTIKRPVKRIILAEANDLMSMAFIHPDPVSLVVGWAAVGRMDKGTLAAYRRKFPAIDGIAEVGSWTADTFSVEKALSLKPDLVLLTAYQDPKLGAGAIAQAFEAAGVPVVFVTAPGSAHMQATDIAPRMTLLGKILGREKEADAVIAFYREHLEHVRRRIAQSSPPRPKVLIDTYAGLSNCCRAPGRHGWSEFVDLAGGQNLSAADPSSGGGMMSMEYILAQNPDVYIGNGGSYMEVKAKGKGLLVGPAYTAEESRETLARLMQRPGFPELKAVKDGQVYGVWTALALQPENILLAEIMAKWLHPDLFRDLDPKTTLAEINRRFLAVPMEGVYWVGLKKDAP